MSECPSPECHEDRMLVKQKAVECHEYLFKSGGVRDVINTCVERGVKTYSAVFGDNDSPGLKEDTVRRSTIRMYILSFAGVIVIMLSVAITMWAQTQKVPELVVDNKDKERRLVAVETVQKQTLEVLNKLQENQNIMLEKLTRLETQVRINKP